MSENKFTIPDDWNQNEEQKSSFNIPDDWGKPGQEEKEEVSAFESGTRRVVGGMAKGLAAFGPDPDKPAEEQPWYRRPVASFFTDVSPEEMKDNPFSTDGALDDYGDEQLDKAAEWQPEVPSYKDVDGLGSGLTYVGERLANSAPYMAALATGNPAAYGTIALSNTGDIVDQQQERGEETNLGRATAAGIGSTVLESIVPRATVGLLKSPVKEGVTKAVVKGSVGEGLTELAQETATEYGVSGDVKIPEQWDEALVAGMAMGGTMTGAGQLAGKAMEGRVQAEPTPSEAAEQARQEVKKQGGDALQQAQAASEAAGAAIKSRAEQDQAGIELGEAIDFTRPEMPVVEPEAQPSYDNAVEFSSEPFGHLGLQPFSENYQPDNTIEYSRADALSQNVEADIQQREEAEQAVLNQQALEQQQAFDKEVAEVQASNLQDREQALQQDYPLQKVSGLPDSRLESPQYREYLTEVADIAHQDKVASRRENLDDDETVLMAIRRHKGLVQGSVEDTIVESLKFKLKNKELKGLPSQYLRKNGGMTLDDMATALYEDGFNIDGREMTVNELSEAIDNELAGRPMFADFQGRSIEDERYKPKAVTNRITEPAVKAALNGEPLSPVYQREVARLLNEAENDPVFEAPAFINEQEARIEQDRQANALPEGWFEQWEPVDFDYISEVTGLDTQAIAQADWEKVAEFERQMELEEAAAHEQKNQTEESDLERTAGQSNRAAGRTNVDGQPVQGSSESSQGIQEETGTSQTEPEVTPSDFSLETQTEQSLQQQAGQQQAAEAAARESQKQEQQKAEADKERDDFALTGSDAVSDQATARGQGDLLSGNSSEMSISSTANEGEKSDIKADPSNNDQIKKPAENKESEASSSEKGASQQTKSTKPKSDTQIEDFGEKIGGARKDIWSGFRESLSGDVDVKALPLSKTFPEPNYEKLHEAGADIQSLAIIAAVRADIPAKPRRTYKLKSWAENVEAARQIASLLVEGQVSSERVLEVMKQDGNAPEGILNIIPVLAKLEPGQLKAAAGFRIRSGSFSIFNGQQRSPNKPIYYLKDNKSKRSHYDQSSESLSELQEQVLGFIREQLENTSASKGRQTRFDVFRTRGTKSYWVGKKIAAGKFVTLKTGFDSIGEAKQFLKENQDWLEQELKRKKDVPAHRRSVNQERQGEDYRQDQDVTPDTFSEAFGFRGVEFGNWVEQGRRQHDLNRAYDALKDLASLINVPTQALSLNGELALAFGARGKGGKKPAAAHYERDKVAINLTKNNGPGSLAHEWWHSLDNYFSRFRDQPDEYLSEHPKKNVWQPGGWQRDEHIRSEVEDAFEAVVKAIEATGMPERSGVLDGTRSKDYWSTVREMTARAFENYVIEKLEASGFHNDYLANIVPELEFRGSPDSYPYLTAKEKESVVGAFDQLFASLKTEATDKGVKLYRLGSGKGIKLNNARLVAHRMKKELGVGVEAVASESELPDYLQQDIRRDNVSGRVKGLYDPVSGKAFIIADKLNDARDAVKTLLHELVGHKGVRQALGNKLNLTMVGIYRDMPADVRQSLEAEYAGQLEGLSSGKRKMRVAEEYVARMAESNPQAPLLKRLYSKLKRLLRNVMPSIQWTDADIVELVQAGKKALRKSEGSYGRTVAESMAYSLDDKQVLKVNPRQLIRKGRIAFLRKKMLELAEKLDGKSVINQATGQKIWFYKKGFKHSSSGHIDHNNELAVRLMPVIPEIVENAVPFETTPDRKGRRSIKTATKLRAPIQLGNDQYYVDLRIREHSNDEMQRLYDHRVRKEDPAGIDGEHPHNLVIADVSLHPTTGPNLNIDQRKAEKFNDDEGSLYSLETVDSGSDTGSGSEGGRSNFVVTDETWQDAFIRKIQDKFKPLKRTQDAISLNGAAPLSEDVDTYLAEELSHGKIEESLRQFENRHVRPLARAIAQASVDREELDLYLYAKHAPERNAHIARINDKMPDGGSGMTNAQAEDILAHFEADGKTAELQSLADRVYRINQQRLSLMREAGLESKEVLDSWARYQNYIPLKGKGEQVESAPHRQNTGRGFDIRGKESMRAMGRRSMAESPLLHSLAAFEETLVRKEKNEVAKVFLKMVQKHPNKDYWEVFSEDRLDTKRMFDPRTEKVVDRVNPFMKFDRDGYFSVKVNGKEHYIKLADKQLLEAMQNLGPEKLGVVTQMLSKANRFLASLNTSMNPEFVISNFSRDIQTAVLNVIAEQDLSDGRIEGEQLAKEVVKDVPGAMRGIWRNLREKGGEPTEYQKWFDDFREDGGKIGFFGLNDFDVQAKRIKELITVAEGGRKGQALELWSNLRDLIEDSNAAVENAVRLSAYVNARKASVSRKKAASLAKNLTVNFNRKGELGVYMNALYMFFNAGVQGTAQFARVMKSRRTQAVAAGLAGASLLLAEWNRMVAGEDDDGENWWDKVPDYVKERNLVLMKWWKDDGSYITVPLPYGYNVFHVAGTLTDDLIRGQKSVPEVAAESVKALLGAFNPIGLQDSEETEKAVIKSVSPTVLSPVVQLAVNENFYGAPIYKEGFPGATPRPDSVLAMKSTKPLFRDLSTWLNEATGGTGFRSGWVDISPDSIEHLFEFTTGGVGAFAGRSFNAAFGDKKLSEMEDREIPFWRKLNGTVSEYKDIQTFYDRLEEVNQYRDEYKAMPASERAEYRSEYGNYLKLSSMARNTRKRLKTLQDRIDLVENSDRPDAEKEALLERLRKRVNLEVDRFNGEYGELVE